MNNGPQQIPVLVAMFDSGCSFNYGGSRTAHHITIADTVQQGDCHTLLSPDPATNTEQCSFMLCSIHITRVHTALE